MGDALLDAPQEVFELREAASVPAGEAVQPDGTVHLHLIRPCVGRGKGRHLYEAAMLERDAHVFRNWRMFVDHRSEQARKAAGGLPRSVRDLGGRVMESWWDGSVPPDPTNGFGQGAVVGRVKPTPFVRELIENDSEIIQASINATATGVRPVQTGDGQRAWLVEGIVDKGSVDWVTEAGAGGRVVSVMESVYASLDGEEATLLEALTDEEFAEYLASERPGLLEAVAEAEKGKAGGSGGDGEDDPALEDKIKALVKKGLPRNIAERTARKAMTQAKVDPPGDGEEGGDVALTPDALREALETPEMQDYLSGLIEARVEESLDTERDLIRAEARAEAERGNALRDMRDTAAALIAESRLPDDFAAEVRSRFTLTEAGPTPGLDVIDEVDDEGKVTKSASVVLREAVQAEIERQRRLVASLRPTRVRGQGPQGEGGKDGEQGGEPKVGSLTAALLQEAGFDDPDKVYATA